MSPINNDYYKFKVYDYIMNSKNFNYSYQQIAQNNSQLYRTLVKLLLLIYADPICLLNIYPYLNHDDINITLNNISKFQKQALINYFQFAIVNKHKIKDYDNFKHTCNEKLQYVKENNYISDYEYDLWKNAF